MLRVRAARLASDRAALGHVRERFKSECEWYEKSLGKKTCERFPACRGNHDERAKGDDTDSHDLGELRRGCLPDALKRHHGNVAK